MATKKSDRVSFEFGFNKKGAKKPKTGKKGRGRKPKGGGS
jgi:hypothetical protein